MTNDHTTARWRRIAATSVIFITAVTGATATAITADGRIKNGSQDFDACIQDAINYRKAHHYDINMDEIQVGCCAYIGGQIVTEADGTTFKDCIFNTTTVPDRPAPPPGAVIVPHPGDNQGPLGPRPTRLRPSVVLPPGVNQTGIQ